MREVSTHYGVTPASVRNWLDKLGMKRRTNSEAQILLRGTEELTRDKLIELTHAKDLSQDEIARMYGVTQSSVKEKLKSFGIKARSRSNPGAKNGMYGRGHTPEAKEKIRQANRRQFDRPGARDLARHNQVQAIADGKFNVKTIPENLVAAELDRRGIPYTRQENLRDPATGRFFACVDFMLSDGTVVEVQGSFWHADPRLYPDGPVKKSQRRTVENDNRKRVRMRELNIPLIEVWELDILENVEQALSVIGSQSTAL